MEEIHLQRTNHSRKTMENEIVEFHHEDYQFIITRFKRINFKQYNFVVCLDDLRGNCFIKLRISNDKHSSLYDKMKKAIVQKVKSDSIIDKKNEVILFLPNTLNTIDKIQATVQLFGQIITITAPMIYNQKGA